MKNSSIKKIITLRLVVMKLSKLIYAYQKNEISLDNFYEK